MQTCFVTLRFVFLIKLDGWRGCEMRFEVGKGVLHQIFISVRI